MVKLVKGNPAVEDYLRLRSEAGMSERSKEGAEIGLKNTWYGTYLKDGENTIGMGRIIGDGGTAFQVVDIVIIPKHQGRGLGKRIMNDLMDYFNENAPANSYISLIADGDARHLYEKYGFKDVRPKSIGMGLRK